MDVNKNRRQETPKEGRSPKTTTNRSDDKEEKAPYKREPTLKNVTGIIEECHETAFKFKVEPLGELPCPVPSEVE